MDSGKADNQLNLALDATEEEREKSLDLEVGYEPAKRRWELIVRYVGSLDRIREELSATVTVLMNGFAVITVPESQVARLEEYEEIIFIEKPKRLFFAVNQGKAISCILPVTRPPYALTGKGVIVGLVDSGIDYSHPDFRKEDGSTRILGLWDQTIPAVSPGNGVEMPDAELENALGPPSGYAVGTLYTEERINEALNTGSREMALRLVPSVDLSGHGTHVDELKH